jgi:hypothetical protein
MGRRKCSMGWKRMLKKLPGDIDSEQKKKNKRVQMRREPRSPVEGQVGRHRS